MGAGYPAETQPTPLLLPNAQPPPSNSPPTTSNITVSVLENTPLQFSLRGDDPDLDALNYAVVQSPSNGQIAVQSPGGQLFPLQGQQLLFLPQAITYVPNQNFVGSDSFTYTANDGSTTSNVATVTVVVASVPQPPHITSTPTITAAADQLYRYQVSAQGTGLRYTVVGPQGMTIDQQSGLILWIPDGLEENPSVTVHVENVLLESDSQRFNISVLLPPKITSSPPLSATIGSLYTYAVTADSLTPNAVLHFTLPAAPATMTIDQRTGLIQWTPQATDAGDHAVTIEVDNQVGGSARQSFSIHVGADTQPPALTVTAIPPFIYPGQSTTVTIVASDDVRVASTSLTVNGSPISLSGTPTFATAMIQASAPGAITLQATGTDEVGNVGTASARIGVGDPTDTTPPLVALSSPAENALILTSTAVRGSASDQNLVSYTLSIARTADNAFVTIGSGPTVPTNGILGTIDPTLLLNGLYRLQLSATDINQQTSVTEIPVQIAGRAKVGPMRLSFTDLSIPLAGVPITITRAYDSRLASAADFGFGWTLSISSAVTTAIDGSRFQRDHRGPGS